jgi:hypothetical protein
MSKQFENPKAAKLEDDIVADPTKQEKIDRVADKAAAKPAKVQQKYDSDHTIISN